MKRIARAALVVLVAVYLVEALIFLGQGRTNIDEGMFLNAGRLVYEGRLLYRDFPFSQGPLVPYVYGAVLQVFGSSVLVGRVVSFLLALVTVGATFWIARALGGRTAAAVAMALTIVNLPALWVAVTVRTQSLATPLVMLAAVALASGRRGVLGWAAVPSLLLWASGARLTTLVAFAAASLWVALQLRKSASLLLRVAILVGVQALVIFSPLWLAPGASRFHVLTSQLTRGGRFGSPPDLLLDRVLAKVGFFFQPETDFFPLLPLALAVVVYLGWSMRGGWRPDLTRPLGDPLTAQLTLVALAVLVFLPHLLLSHGFLTYFVTSSALLIPAIAIGVAHWCRESSRGAPIVVSIVASLLAVALLSVPFHWSTWVGSGESSFSAFREVARDLRKLAGSDCTMVTMETALAVEAGCRVLPGLEYSAFSYRPDLSEEEAERWGVLNPTLLRERVRELRPELIALGPTGFGALRRGLKGLAPPHAGTDGEPSSLGFLGSDAYTFHDTYRIPSGIRMGWTPDVVSVAVFKRKDLP